MTAAESWAGLSVSGAGGFILPCCSVTASGFAYMWADKEIIIGRRNLLSEITKCQQLLRRSLQWYRKRSLHLVPFSGYVASLLWIKYFTEYCKEKFSMIRQSAKTKLFTVRRKISISIGRDLQQNQLRKVSASPSKRCFRVTCPNSLSMRKALSLILTVDLVSWIQTGNWFHR